MVTSLVFKCGPNAQDGRAEYLRQAFRFVTDNQEMGLSFASCWGDND
jgi:hypothetical protein